jgi:hypothetical protein
MAGVAIETHMTNFEFVFSLLVILLGLGLSQVLGGFASAVKRRPTLKIGWGTGLLAIWVTTETVIFWEVFWRMRDALPWVTPAIFAGLAITALYYFAASLVFPDDLDRRTSLDDYFMQEKGRVVGAILLAVLLSLAFRAAVLGWAWNVVRWYAWASWAIIYAVAPVAALTKRRKVAIGCLAVLVVVDLLDPIGNLLWPG